MDFREIIRRSAEAAGRPLNLDQERVTRKMEELADRFRAQRGMSRRQFLKSQLGLAAFFLAANHVFGHFFQVEPAEAESLDAGVTASGAAEPFIFDIQVPFVHDHYPAPGNLLSLRTRAQEWNPELNGKQPVLADLQYEHFYREVFERSSTDRAVLSNTPADQKRTDGF